jgi:hypothetical protein
MKKIRGEKPIGIAIYIQKEISQGNPLCSYLYLKQAKMSFFFFLSFFFYKITERGAKQVLWDVGVPPVGGGMFWGKGIGR